MRAITRIFAAVAITCSALSGCNSPTALAANAQEPEQGSIVVDQRPPEDKTSRTGSYWIWKAGYGIQLVGDDATSPSRIDLLQRDLSLGLRAENIQYPIVLKRYRISLDNKASQTGKAVAAGLGGGLGALAFHALSSNESSSLSVEIDAVVNERLLSVHTVYHPDAALNANWGEQKNSTALLAAMSQAHAELITQIKLAHVPDVAMPVGAFRRLSELVPEADQN